MVQKEALDDIRQWAPGEVFWDAAVSFVHFELQALAGAARVLVDELLFLIASRYHSSLSRTQEEAWKAAVVFRKPIAPRSSTDVPEVHRLRGYSGWFCLLNTYRNTFYHRGWLHGSGHFDGGRKAAKSPRMNALLVPDQSSISGRSRPHEWTWHDGTTADFVASQIYEKLQELLSELCDGEWNTPIPSPGCMPDNERPNVIVTLPVPLIVTIGDVGLVPIFSSRERAENMVTRAPSGATGSHELIEVKSNSHVVDEVEAINLSLAWLEPAQHMKSIIVCLDPEPVDNSWHNITCKARAEIPLDDLMRDDIKIVSVPVDKPMTVFIWRVPFLMA